jgi:hypothetical protein
MTKLANPVPLFLNANGTLIDAGKIYVGVANQDPELNPIAVFWDRERTKPALQPLRTLGGVVVNGYSPAFVYFAEEDYSLRIRDADDNEVIYIKSSTDEADVQYQPLDSDLTAIAALSTTAFGRALLTLANSAELKAATGIPDSLPLTGGILTGNVSRQSAGVHLYHVGTAMTSGRVFGPEYTTDPTTAVGDIWLKPNG